MITLSEKRVGALLTGCEVAVSVGEPWDFSSADGDNVLRGRIEVVRTNPEAPHQQEIVLSVTPFEARTGHRIERLTAWGRYVEDTGIVERIAAGEDAEVNLLYDDQVPEAERDPKGTPKLIGGFHLVED